MGNMCNDRIIPTKTNDEHLSFIDDQMEIKFKNTRIFVCVGDIVQEDADALVQIQNRNLNPSSIISQQMNELAGEQLTQEINSIKEKEGKMSVGAVFYTHSGELHCDYVFHCCLPTYSSSIKVETEIIHKIVGRCLQIANEELKINSIAFPLIINHQMSISPIKAASVMFQCIKNYLNSQQHVKIKQLYLIHSSQRGINHIYRAFKMIFDSKTLNQGEMDSLFDSCVSDDMFLTHLHEAGKMEKETFSKLDKNRGSIVFSEYNKKSF